MIIDDLDDGGGAAGASAVGEVRAGDGGAALIRRLVDRSNGGRRGFCDRRRPGVETLSRFLPPVQQQRVGDQLRRRRLLQVLLLPIGITSGTTAILEVVALHQFALGRIVHRQPVTVDLVELLLLPQDLLLGLGVVLILLLWLLRLLILLLIRGGRTAILRVVVTAAVIVVVVDILPLTLATRVLFLLGPLQDKLHIARVLAPLHQDLQRVLVGGQQPFVVAPPFDEGEATRFAGGMGQGKHHVLTSGDFRHSANNTLYSFDPYFQFHRQSRGCCSGWLRLLPTPVSGSPGKIPELALILPVFPGFLPIHCTTADFFFVIILTHNDDTHGDTLTKHTDTP